MIRILKTILIIILTIACMMGLNLLLWWLAFHVTVVFGILIGVILFIFGKTIYDSLGDN